MTKSEFKKYWNSKTLGEVRSFYNRSFETLENEKEILKDKSKELSELDSSNKMYMYKLRTLSDDIKSYAKSIIQDTEDLAVIKTILDKKELEGIDQAEYENYITNNVNIKVLIDAVNKDKQDFINSGCKVTVNYKNESKEITLTEKEVNEIYDTMLKELIMIIKDNIGNIKEVIELKSNGNRGMDGTFKGDKGTLNISTILAGGYNIQQLHYRTLVQKY